LPGIAEVFDAKNPRPAKALSQSVHMPSLNPQEWINM